MCKDVCRFTGRSGNVAVRFTSALAISWTLVAVAFGETLPVLADSYTRSDAPNGNFGSASKIRVRSPSHAGYLFFDLGSLGSGGVLGASLRIHVQKVDNGANVAVHEVLGDWSEGTLTYQNAPPSNLIPTAESPVTPGDVGDFLAVDVTALVNGWIANPSSNFGLSLQSQPSGKNILFGPREGDFPAELEVELVGTEKPNFARVEVQGGDYSNPVDAVNDSDSWCELSPQTSFDHCQLLIGPGTFPLAEPLNLFDGFDVIGAGNTGSQRTELVAQSGVETVIQLLETGLGRRGNVISDLRVRNSGGANSNVRGIWSVDPTEDGTSATIRNVSVDVSGGMADATTGISVGRPVLRNVEVSVNGGSNAVGIFSSCADAADVRVRVGPSNAQSSVGWREISDCEPPIVRFNVSAFGPNSIGMDFGTMGGEQFAEGIVVTDGVGIRSIGGSPGWRNVRIAASPTAIQLQFSDLALLDNIDAPSSEVALDVRNVSSAVQLTDSTVSGEIRVAPGATPTTLRIDSSSIGAITIEDGASVFIGSSKVTGPLLSGTGQVTCINVYDGNYEPLTCN